MSRKKIKEVKLFDIEDFCVNSNFSPITTVSDSSYNGNTPQDQGEEDDNEGTTLHYVEVKLPNGSFVSVHKLNEKPEFNGSVVSKGSYWYGSISNGYYDFDLFVRREAGDLEYSSSHIVRFRTFPNCCGILTCACVDSLTKLTKEFFKSMLCWFALSYSSLEFYHVIPDALEKFDIEHMEIEKLETKNPKTQAPLYRYTIDLGGYKK